MSEQLKSKLYEAMALAKAEGNLGTQCVLCGLIGLNLMNQQDKLAHVVAEHLRNVAIPKLNNAKAGLK